MMTQFLPGLMMFAITLVFVIIFFLPATLVKHKNELVRFYWVGFWGFLAMIAAISGGAETLNLLNYETGNIPLALLTALTTCLVIFVMFGWWRLSFAAIHAGITRWFATRRKA